MRGHSNGRRWTGSAIALGLAELVALALIPACAAASETALRRDLDRAGRSLATATSMDAEPRPPSGLDRGLDAYVANALRNSPQLRASFERWRAAVNMISQARRLPEPMLSYGYYVLNADTTAGPTHRLGLEQAFPWPTKLTAGADAASARARALQRQFDAEAVALRARVTAAYLRPWLVRRTREIEQSQLELLRGLAEAARARVATGSTSLADQQQIDVAVTRLEDEIAGLDEQERATVAELLAAIGASPGTPAPTTTGPPEPTLPAESEQALLAALATHPAIESYALLSEASSQEARAAKADRFGGFSLGLEWMTMGAGSMSGEPVDRRDTLIVGIGVNLPLWQGSYSDSVRAAQAEAAAQEAAGRAALDRAAAELSGAQAALRDSRRRVRLTESTLRAQVRSAFDSVLGAYVVGRSTVTALLMAQRDLLEVELALERARVDHALAWARLESAVGRPVAARPAADEQGDE
jgi:cobalt-zinc-cadmium efflux system outer membrane protein